MENILLINYHFSKSLPWKRTLPFLILYQNIRVNSFHLYNTSQIKSLALASSSSYADDDDSFLVCMHTVCGRHCVSGSRRRRGKHWFKSETSQILQAFDFSNLNIPGDILSGHFIGTPILSKARRRTDGSTLSCTTLDSHRTYRMLMARKPCY